MNSRLHSSCIFIFATELPLFVWRIVLARLVLLCWAVLTIIGRLIFLGGGGQLLYGGFTLGIPIMGLIGLGDLFLGSATIITGVGFLNARPWSRILGLALSLVILVASGIVVNFGTHEGLSFGPPGLFYGVPVATIMVYYLTRYELQAYLQNSKAQVLNR